MTAKPSKKAYIFLTYLVFNKGARYFQNIILECGGLEEEETDCDSPPPAKSISAAMIQECCSHWLVDLFGATLYEDQSLASKDRDFGVIISDTKVIDPLTVMGLCDLGFSCVPEARGGRFA